MPTATLTPEKEYVAHVDSKRRMVVRNGTHTVYRVLEYHDGHMVLIPCEIVPSPKIKKGTLAQIERSIVNLKKGKVSEPVDIKAALKLYR